MLRIKISNDAGRKVHNIYRLTSKIKHFSTDGNELPKHADVVIVGGGVAGCSTFYHLCKKGIKTILLERNKISSGTTWHSGAIVWSCRGSDIEVELLQKTRNLLANLENETGICPGWINSGGLFIARTPERLEEYKRFHTLGHAFNIDSQLLTPTETQKFCPLLNPQAFCGALWSPSDGYTDPNMYCSALIQGAVLNGGKLFEDTLVENVLTEPAPNNGKKIVGVQTPNGTINTSVLVNSSGVWSREIAQMVGLDIPLTPIKHGYVVTNSVPGAKGMPCIRDHDAGIYFKAQGDSIVFGGYERNPEIIKELPHVFYFSLFELDLALFETHLKHGSEICPSLETAGMKADIYGPEAFTPDHKPILGEDPKCIGLFHANGFNSFGFNYSGGAGEQLAEWIATGRPGMPLYEYDVRRFTSMQRKDRAWVEETGHECYATIYDIRHPLGQPLAGRNHKIGPFHEALIANGGIMEQALDWERPAYFIKDYTAPVRAYDWYGYYGHVENEDQRYKKEMEQDITFDFSKHHTLIKEEALAARTNVALFDLTSYTKMYLTGPDAKETADWLFTSNLDKQPGSVINTFSLNSKGGVEAVVSIVPLKEGVGTLVGPILKGDGYYIVTEAKCGYQVKSHLRKQLNIKNFKSVVTDTSNRIGTISLQGPKSRQLLQSVTEYPITDEKLPYGMSELIKIEGNTCRAIRTSSIGELGYEIHIPMMSCVPIFNKIVDAGRGFNMKFAGHRALESLNCEKGYHRLNFDVRIDDNPVEAGLTRFCKKDGHYLGKQTVERAKQEGVRKQRVFFIIDVPVALYGLETIWRDDSLVGYLRRGDYGFSLDGSIGLGYVERPKGKIVDKEFLQNGSYKIEVRNKKYPATLFLESPFDPYHQRILGRYDHHNEEEHQTED